MCICMYMCVYHLFPKEAEGIIRYMYGSWLTMTGKCAPNVNISVLPLGVSF